MKLSVVIVNYNVAYFLEQCLLSADKAIKVLNNEYGSPNCEVFVVDNQSTDDSVVMVKQKFPWVKLIVNDENLGFSKANNQAIRLSNGQYVLLLNPDTLVESDTFLKVIRFMDEHPEAGGLGVKMLDGKGNFLPESKRGLPTPWVAFYKIFGLAKLFPKSKKFGRYHLGYLPVDKTNSIEVLSGAFMLMRKETLDKTGLLDEAFFMYGEDIDLSYRILQAGYKNYYFPETRIIHYKGESTKKSSVNYVFIFYKAMIIFARKHFKQSNAQVFSFLIHFAIYLRAGIAIAIRIIKKASLPLLDGAVLFGCMFLLKRYWELNHKYIEGGEYPPVFTLIVIPAYILIWLTGIFFSGGYEKPYKTGKILRGVIWGTMVILVGYALLSEEYRFSRALILLGAALASVTLMGIRLLIHFINYGTLNIESSLKKKVVIAGTIEECKRIESLIRSTRENPDIIGYLTLTGNESVSIGKIDQLEDLISIYQIQEVIFCGKDLTSGEIINFMSSLQYADLEFKIAPPESEFIIGSNSINRKGEMYVVGLNSINKPSNVRKKRIVDLGASLLLFIFSPILIWKIKKPVKFYKNLMHVFFGNKTWIGYSSQFIDSEKLPKIKPGIIYPEDGLKVKINDIKTLLHLNILYAKDYIPATDFNLILKNIPNLGK